MPVFRRIVTAIMVACILFFSLLGDRNVAAEDDGNAISQKKTLAVDALINQIGELRAEKILKEELSLNSRVDEANGISDARETDLDDQIEDLERSLQELDVEILSDDQINEMMGDDGVRAVVPGSTSSLKWYSSRATYTYWGQEYMVHRVYAQALSSASNLAVIDSGSTLYDCEDVVITENTDILSIYVSKAVGLVPWLSYLPYELTGGTFTYLSGTVDEVCSATYSIMGTVCFSYVYPIEDGDDWEMLSFVSTSFKMAAAVSVAGVQNENPYAYTYDEINGTTASTNYSSLEMAVQAYVNGASAPRNSYVDYIQFKGPDGKLAAHVNLPTPDSPLHVH